MSKVFQGFDLFRCRESIRVSIQPEDPSMSRRILNNLVASLITNEIKFRVSFYPMETRGRGPLPVWFLHIGKRRDWLQICGSGSKWDAEAPSRARPAILWVQESLAVEWAERVAGWRPERWHRVATWLATTLPIPRDALLFGPQERHAASDRGEILGNPTAVE